MVEEQKNYINKLYEYIVDEISISDKMLDKAIKSYGAVGKWLGDCDPGLDIKIMPQGSVNLGTVIKPISDEDDYDIDLVCLLKNGGEMKASEIKEIVGRRLKEHKTYNEMLENEGKRCWTLRYEEFHMDILPSVPKNHLYIEPEKTEIRLTHKLDNGSYIDKFSNPAKYKLWFEDRMKTVLLESKRTFAMKNQVEIDDVPTYSVRTPLQKAIQLLKRHRDISFANILHCTRQLHYSLKNENSIDIVLFLNGIPVVSMELKCQFTGQSTTNAINQYKFDRAGKDAIFAFKERVLVHFAVDLTNVYMTTMIMRRRRSGRATLRITTVPHSCYYLQKIFRIWQQSDMSRTTSSSESYLMTRI